MSTSDTTGGLLPFEGSKEIADIVLRLIKQFNIRSFIETGTQRGATALWATRQGLDVVTIEVDEIYHREAMENLRDSGATLLLGHSVDQLPRAVSLVKGPTLFFLDAHGCRIGGTPLRGELQAINGACDSPIITIHDVQVPGHPELGFDKYNDCELSIEFVRECVEAAGFGDWIIGYNTIADGAKRGFCHLTRP